MPERKLTAAEWEAIVVDVLAAQPELAAATVRAMQAGILAALDRREEQLVDVSFGLMEALNTKPGHKRRDHERIVKAIEASSLHATAWSAEAIKKEQA